MGPILSHCSVVPGFWSKHVWSALSVRLGRMDVNLAHLFFSLAAPEKSLGRFFCGGAAGFFRSVLALRETVPLLRAEHAPSRMAILHFFQNDVSARVFVVHCCGGSSFSYPSVWPCASGRAGRLEFYLPTIFRAASLDLVCRTDSRSFDPAVARPLIPVLQRICAQHDSC